MSVYLTYIFNIIRIYKMSRVSDRREESMMLKNAAVLLLLNIQNKKINSGTRWT